MMSRLRYRCRRGTKELDLVLLRFLDERFEALSQPEQEAFEALLEQQDPDIAAWLWGGRAPPEAWEGLIRKIRINL